MYECPACHRTLDEVIIPVTDCCKAEIEEVEKDCPGCGEQEPMLIDDDIRLRCCHCGYVE